MLIIEVQIIRTDKFYMWLGRHGFSSRSINPGRQVKCDNMGIMMKFSLDALTIVGIANPRNNRAHMQQV